MSELNEVTIDWTELAKPVPGFKPGKNILAIKKGTLPIIFVPGIMGSRLKDINNQKVWDPDSAKFMLWNYGMAWVRAADKKKKIIGDSFDEDFLKVYDDDQDHNEAKLSAFPGAAQRGWGGVSWSSYGSILTFLDSYSWKVTVDDPESRQCVIIPLAFELPVYAFGYNWTASNSTAGKLLKEFIDKITAENRCEQVILVTHSMGGLVARSATIEHGAADKVLGIVHGVQPVTGAPAAYWRMKAGFERTGLKSAATAWVLGTDGEEVTALLGNMPGGLQLLPTADYVTNDESKKWLRFEDEDGKRVKELPDSDVYSEIYKNKTDYWRLVNPAMLDPKTASRPGVISGKTPWSEYVTKIDEAKAFHEKLGLTPKSESQAFYGDSTVEHHTADAITFRRQPSGEILQPKTNEWENATWRTTPLVGHPDGPFTATDYLGHRGVSVEYPLKGRYYVEINQSHRRFTLSLRQPEGRGDGTVPSSSGRALHASVNKDVPDIEHEPAFQSEDAQKFTAAAIQKFCLGLIQAKTGKS